MEPKGKPKIIKCYYDQSAPLDLTGARVDPFYYDQPPLEFVDELKKPIYEARPQGYGSRKAEDGELCASGIFIDKGDFTDDPLLKTVYDSFERFTEIYGISGNSYPVTLKKENGHPSEWHRIVFDESSTTVYAADAEGVRRAICYIEGELISREGALFEKGEITRSPVVKSRITRGFFSPTNRPPKFGDELLDDVDYYPGEYLNRLMHDGTNGIWIYTSFKQLMRSARFERCGEECDRRIAKLRDVIKRCKAYGIKVYVLAIEPAYLINDEAEKNFEMLGGFVSLGHYSICMSTEAGRKYLSESVENLFKLLPDLAGYIDITAGERVTNCASYPEAHRNCPRCSKRPIGEVLADTANVIKEAIRRSGTGAEFISWSYGHKLWANDDIREYVRNCDSDIALMQNFEEFSYAEQLGKMRQGKDYWLSNPGPGELFKLTAEEANAHGKTLYAKMQICCSHELASVPYIPAPGLVFEKFKGARRYGVTGVVECWYFGNYPSIMSRAAGELAFESDFKDKDAFVERLAATSYGKSKASAIAKAWKYFEEGYKNYPLNIMFSYYGPMHDSVTWELQLKPKDHYLSRTWLLTDKPDGDRIHEALWYGHTLDEAIALTDRIIESWRKGLEILPLNKDNEASTLANALYVLFTSGNNILRFYKLRRDLGVGEGNARENLRVMREIVEAEILNSQRMLELCKKDKRLGYHSEAEGFKFFPKKIEARIDQLTSLLRTEFVEVEERVERHLSPLEFYEGRENGKHPSGSYFIKCGKGEWMTVPETEHRFRIEYDETDLSVIIDAKSRGPVVVGFEYEPLIPSPTLTFSVDGNLAFTSEVYSHQSIFGDRIADEISKYDLEVKENDTGVRYVLKAKRADIGWSKSTPFRIRMKIDGAPLRKTKLALRLLAQWEQYADTHVWVIPR